VDLVSNGIRPEHGVISIRFWNRFGGEALIQAIEVGPGASPAGARPLGFRGPAEMAPRAEPSRAPGKPGR